MKRSICSTLAILAATAIFLSAPQSSWADSNKQPAITSVRADPALVSIEIAGVNLGTNPPRVTIGNVASALTITSATQTLVTALLPPGLAPGGYLLTFSAAKNKSGRDDDEGSNYDEFWVTLGAAGPQGPAGPAGAQGPMGATGLGGSPGMQGPVGPQGPQGLQGTPGARGNGIVLVGPATQDACADGGQVFQIVGEQGPVAGSETTVCDGLQGLIGAAGPQGPAGPSGAQGPMGATGLVGPAGAKGDPGAQGLAGLAGVAGPAGIAGPQGLPGANGADGIAGVPGATGPAGANGAAGPAGPQGSPGRAGNSIELVGAALKDECESGGYVFQIVNDKGPINGTRTTICNGLRGVAGATGPAGPAGATGATGAQGPAGPTGATGPSGQGRSYSFPVINKVMAAANTYTTGGAGCPADSSLVSGGFMLYTDGFHNTPLSVTNNLPFFPNNEWIVQVTNSDLFTARPFTVFAVCMR